MVGRRRDFVINLHGGMLPDVKIEFIECQMIRSEVIQVQSKGKIM